MTFLLDNVGEYLPTKVKLNCGICTTGIIGGSEFIKISAVPLNESVVKPYVTMF